MKKGSRKRILAMLMSMCVVFGTLSVPKVALAATVATNTISFTKETREEDDGQGGTTTKGVYIFRAENDTVYEGDLDIGDRQDEYQFDVNGENANGANSFSCEVTGGIAIHDNSSLTVFDFVDNKSTENDPSDDVTIPAKLKCGVITGDPSATVMLGNGSKSIETTTKFYDKDGEELTGEWDGFHIFEWRNMNVTTPGWYEMDMGGGDPDPGNGSVKSPIRYIGLHDMWGVSLPYEEEWAREEFGYIEYCTQAIDGTVSGTVPVPNPDDPANDGFNWDEIDWTKYTWEPYEIEYKANNPTEPVDGAISFIDGELSYKLPDNVTMVRVYSLSNYWCMVRGVNQDGYRGISYHAILLEDGTIKNDKDCTPEEFDNGTKITSNIFVIDGSDGYLVEFSPHNILWYNDEATAKERGGEDALVTGGRVEFVSCSLPDSSDPYDGLVGSYETDEDGKPIVEFLDKDGRVLGGGCAALEGAILTLRFIPDYGYQFKEAMINGRPVVPQDDNYTFEFQFPQGTYHLNVEFVPGEDKASGSAEGVGTVEAVSGTEGDESIVGNLMIDGEEADLTDAEEAAMAAALEADSSIDMSIIEDAYIDLTLQSYAEKGDTDEYWSETLTETDEDVTVSINVTDSVAAKIEAAGGECSVVRAHGSGSDVSYTVLPATYDPAEKIITFVSNQFSTFAIATGDEPECPHVETEIKDAKEATCKEKGYTGDKVCKSCGEVVEKGSEIAATGKHTYDEGKVTTEPTTDTEGVKTYTCTVCGDTKTEAIEKLPAKKTGEWKEDSTGWWYQRTDGSYPADAWEQIDGKWYLFDAAGYMLTGWQQVGGKWYYLKSDGAMAYSTVVDGYTLDASGAWVDYGWKQDANGWWYKHADGSYPASAWELIDGEWYLFDASGYMLTGWQKVGGIWYYLYTSGAMAKDTTIDGYVIGASGAMVENGWRQDSTGWWYLNSDGSFPAACWKLIDMVWYRFNAAGYMQTGWIDDDGTWYYAESNGTLATGWKQIGSTWYYFFGGGAMAVDTEVDGYKINSDGAWVE